ncbi:MAG TPA: DUF5691 domain-containing protein [Candidatus Competibacter sp.]|nr:hypothetical protein [Candidatus Competibacteraceae bacterium]HUM95594.1 DUF5691 domain-containing protein [Candidatus Competibacter sp.]
MNPLHDLATQALLGSERRPPVLTPLPGAVDDLLDAASPSETALEIRVLRRAGVLAACADAGYVPAAGGAEPPPLCEAESLLAATDPQWRAALVEIFQDGPDLLQREALRQLAEYGAVLPPKILPLALTAASKTPALQALLRPVLGQRGRWLARFNPDWAYALSGDDAELDFSLWERGTLEARKAFLRQLRRRDPAAARTTLETALTELDARERLTLLEQLSVNLDASDEDFLENRLTDRGKEVRGLVANLLARLPDSRHVARMIARLAPCLRQERKLLRQHWVIEPPSAFGADWKADAIEETRAKSESLGERAWWLYQIARALPLAWWSERLALSPAELIGWAKKSDWSEALLRAWHDALTRERNPVWAAAFLGETKLPGLTVDPFALIDHLPPAERESYWLRLLNKSARRSGVGEWLGRISQSGTPCSAEFARQVLQHVRATVASDAGKWDYSLRQALPDFICLMPVALLDETLQHWPVEPEAQYFSETLARLIAIAERRKTLYRPPTSRNPS